MTTLNEIIEKKQITKYLEDKITKQLQEIIDNDYSTKQTLQTRYNEIQETAERFGYDLQKQFQQYTTKIEEKIKKE